MATQVTVSVPDAVYNRAKTLSQLIDENIETVLAMMLELSLPRFDPDVDLSVTVDQLDDMVLLSATKLRLVPAQNERHQQLLNKQQNETLTSNEINELQTLNRVYELGIVYQSQALAEAAKRGLIDEQLDSR